jgi:hypothetical protein
MTDAPLQEIAAAVVGLVVVLTPIANHFKGKKRDAGRKSEFVVLAEKIDKNHLATTQQFAAVNIELRDLKAHVIGPDGENGIRGDVRELKEDVKGILERERDSRSRRAS